MSSSSSSLASTTTGPTNAEFFTKAEGICTQHGSSIQADLNALHAPQLGALPLTISDASSLSNDFGSLITDLRALGNPPNDTGGFSLGLEDWQQALDQLTPGDTENFVVNYTAGINEFKDLGLKVCSSG